MSHLLVEFPITFFLPTFTSDETTDGATGKNTLHARSPLLGENPTSVSLPFSLHHGLTSFSPIGSHREPLLICKVVANQSGVLFLSNGFLANLLNYSTVLDKTKNPTIPFHNFPHSRSANGAARMIGKGQGIVTNLPTLVSTCRRYRSTKVAGPVRPRSRNLLRSIMARCSEYNGYRKITKSSNIERGCCLDG
ncbi:hypothetical protein J6590_034648 [Homalodisca vitripennis]|nr:hypothetical protein J6590_034648 [Homalodisca vitripennis]